MGLLLPGFVIFMLGKKVLSGTWNGASGWRTARLGVAIYINDDAE